MASRRRLSFRAWCWSLRASDGLLPPALYAGGEGCRVISPKNDGLAKKRIDAFVERLDHLGLAPAVTSLSLSAMAIGVSYGAILLGVAFTLLGIVVAGLGYALLALITPEVARKLGLHLSRRCP